MGAYVCKKCLIDNRLQCRELYPGNMGRCELCGEYKLCGFTEGVDRFKLNEFPPKTLKIFRERYPHWEIKADGEKHEMSIVNRGKRYVGLSVSVAWYGNASYEHILHALSDFAWRFE